LKRWRDVVFQTYPQDSLHFLKHQKDPFANPLGDSLSRGLEGLLDTIVGLAPEQGAAGFLDDMVRVRAVQSFKPSQAVSFVFALKDIIRKECSKELRNAGIAPDWSTLDGKIDEMALEAFDLYAQCREKLHEIRVNEIRKSVYGAMSRAKLIVAPLGEEAPDGGGDNPPGS